MANAFWRFRARPEGPSGGQSLFVQGNWTGTLAGAGGPFALFDPQGNRVPWAE